MAYKIFLDKIVLRGFNSTSWKLETTLNFSLLLNTINSNTIKYFTIPNMEIWK